MKSPREASAILAILMNTLPILIVFLFLASSSFAAETKLENERDKLGYTLGIAAAKDLNNRGLDVNPDALRAGIADGLSGKKPRLAESEMKTLVTSAENDIREKRVAARKAQGEKNLVEGPAFLAVNKSREGVKTTASGLQYEVLREGAGRIPRDTDRVVIHFTGMTIDHKEFESSYKSGHAETVMVNRMINGWKEALQLMKSGSKYRLFLPPELAFGKTGAGPIAPNATLIFDLELLGIAETPKTGTVAVPHDPAPASSP